MGLIFRCWAETLTFSEGKTLHFSIPRHFGQYFSILAWPCPSAQCKVHKDLEESDWLTQCPHLNPIEHLWDEVEQRLRARLSHPTLMHDLTNTLLDEWAKIPTEILQNVVKRLSRRVEAIITMETQFHSDVHVFRILCHLGPCWCNGQVS